MPFYSHKPLSVTLSAEIPHRRRKKLHILSLRPLGEARSIPFFLLPVSQSLPLDCDTVFFSVPSQTSYLPGLQLKPPPRPAKTPPAPLQLLSVSQSLSLDCDTVLFLSVPSQTPYPSGLQLAPPPRQAQWSRSTLRNGGAVQAFRFRGRDS